MSFSGWKAKLTAERPYYRIAFSHKEEQTIYLTSWMNLQRITWVKKANLRRTVWCIYTTFLQLQRKNSGIQGLRRGCMRREEDVGVKGIWGTLVVMDQFCTLTGPMSISRLWHCTIVLQDVTIRGNWVKDPWDLFVLFLTSAWELTVISK